MSLWMTEKDIVNMYVNAKNPHKQIKILAELNVTTIEEIKQILDRAKVLDKKARRHGGGQQRQFSNEELIKMAEIGLTMREAAERIGASYSAVAKRAKRNGIVFEKRKSRPASTDREAAGIKTQTHNNTEEALCQCQINAPSTAANV